MNRARKTFAAASVALATACSGGSGEVTVQTAPPVHHPAHEDCPSLPPADGHSGVAVDYVDFVQALGQNYVAGLGAGPTTVKPSELGRVVLRSRCSFSELNDRTQQDPGQPRDGDTAFLQPGTPIYAVDGWSPKCRLAARSSIGLVAYLAMDPDASTAKPLDCALHH